MRWDKIFPLSAAREKRGWCVRILTQTGGEEF